jgi:plastocyanin
MGISRTTVFLPGVALAAGLSIGLVDLHARAGGVIVGTVSTKETGRPALRVTIDPTVCGTSIPDESVVVDAAGRVANAVATVTGVKAAAPAETVVNNEKCRFIPRVSTLKPAGAVKVVNKDPAPVLHTTHAAMVDGKFLFNVSLPFPNFTTNKTVEKAGLVQLACNTHTWMRGWLVVTDELSSISGVDGKFRLEGVPAGVHEVRIWHEALKAAPIKVTVKEGETVTVDVTLIK